MIDVLFSVGRLLDGGGLVQTVVNALHVAMFLGCGVVMVLVIRLWRELWDDGKKLRELKKPLYRGPDG